MKKIKSLLEFILITSFLLIFLYVAEFTTIPNKIKHEVEYKYEETKSVYEGYNENFQINKLTTRTNMFYYNTLTDNQKLIYESIANAIKNFEAEFAVRNLRVGTKEEFAEEVAVAIQAFTNDHPEVFYLSSYYSSYILEGFDGNIGYIKFSYTENTIEDVEEKIEKIDAKIQEYVKNTESMSEYEKELYIHDKLASNVIYKKDEELKKKYHTVEATLLENEGVCDGFSKSLQLLYDRVGLNSIIVLGSLDNGPHAWNMVLVSNEWYFVDLTSSHSIFEETNIVNHAYFNMNYDRAKEFLDFDQPSLLPEANYDDLWIYKRENLIVNSDELLYPQFKRICDIYNDKDYIEFYFNGDVQENISSILVTLKLIDSSFVQNSSMKYYNIKNAIIIRKN